MRELKRVRRNPKEEFLESLRRFEEASGAILGQRTQEGRLQSLANLRAAIVELRDYLAMHFAPKELAEWRELPDSDMEIAAFAYELKMEHADLQRELGDLLLEMDAYQQALDRHEAAMRISSTCRSLAARIARHVAGEQAELGKFTA